jgi:hypothetical protein
MATSDPDSSHLLGWYSFGNSVYITAGFLQDRFRLVEVLNHEETHHILGSTTPYGSTQQIIAACAPAPWEEDDPRYSALQAILANASREAQEAAATFAGLRLMPPDVREALVRLLPPEYERALHTMETFLDGRSFTPERGLTLARGLSARALQTRLLDDWRPLSLSDPATLARYLALEDHNPDVRLVRILGALGTATDAQVDSWVGRFVRGSTGQIRLQPPLPAEVPSLTFSALPTEDDLEARGRIIISTLIGTDQPERRERAEATQRNTLTRPWRPRLVLAPADQAVLPDFPIPRTEWYREVDLIQLRANVLGMSVVERSAVGGEADMLHAGEVVIFPHRPDFLSCPGIVTTQRRLLSRLREIAGERDVALCVEAPSSIPSEFSVRDPGDWDVVDWLPTRRFCVTTHGDANAAVAAFMTARAEPLVCFGLGMTDAWAILIIRRAAQAWPAIIYPTFSHTLDNEIEALAHAVPLTEIEEAKNFFADQDLLRHALRYARMYSGFVNTLADWKRIETDELDAMVAGRWRKSDVLGPGTTFAQEDG